MIYDLRAIEETCLQHGLLFHRSDECTLEVVISHERLLVFANTDQGADTYLGFRDLPWHSHGKLMLMTGDATYFEYEPEELIDALVLGEVLMVSQYVGGQLKDCWLTHRAEKLDLQYIETGEELRVCQIAEPSAAQNGGPATQLGNLGVTKGPPSVS